ncbi:MAG: AAA family ATPase [Promethearchaeota archaeon]|nr:MAG: AAA family ATPase [Candidatus Lokiarchaeota archaeon]
MTEEIPIWRIKYHPKSLDKICEREKVKDTLKSFIQKRNFPHLLFVGSKGIGKTMIAQLFSKEFLGKDYDANFKLIYANVPLSEEERKKARADAYVSTSKIGSIAGRRIITPAFIQARVKPFVQLKVLGDAPFKILIVKNFEALGPNQQGFRRLMERYGINCRMILITTKISSIIDPIVSRSQIILVSRVKFDKFKILIKQISKEESLEISDETIEVLYKISDGKISRAIDFLQLSSISGKTIDMEKLYEISHRYRNDLIRSLLMIAFKGDFPKSRELARKILSNYKFETHEFFKLMIDEINKLPLSKFARSNLINFIADSDFRALDGRDNDIQISALLSKMCAFSEFM